MSIVKRTQRKYVKKALSREELGVNMRRVYATAGA